MDRNQDQRRRRPNQNQGSQPAPNPNFHGGAGNGRSERSIGQGLSNEEKYPMPVRPPKREYPLDPITGAPVDNVYTAFTHRETEQPTSFDAVLDHLRNAENIAENQQLIYVGSGSFGVYEEVEENGRRHLALQRKITYEDSHHKPDWRRELAPGISRDYQPAPQPLSQLYSQDEQSQFPKIGASSGAYIPRTS